MTLFFLHSVPNLNLSLGWIALIGILLLLILADSEDLDGLMARVEWSTLVFFASLFILMEVTVDGTTSMCERNRISFDAGFSELSLRLDLRNCSVQTNLNVLERSSVSLALGLHRLDRQTDGDNHSVSQRGISIGSRHTTVALGFGVSERLRRQRATHHHDGEDRHESGA